MRVCARGSPIECMSDDFSRRFYASSGVIYFFLIFHLYARAAQAKQLSVQRRTQRARSDARRLNAPKYINSRADRMRRTRKFPHLSHPFEMRCDSSSTISALAQCLMARRSRMRAADDDRASGSVRSASAPLLPVRFPFNLSCGVSDVASARVRLDVCPLGS